MQTTKELQILIQELERYVTADIHGQDWASPRDKSRAFKETLKKLKKLKKDLAQCQ
jgi:hypothetical protein